jgi:ketosteroid isomerase-like protein
MRLQLRAVIPSLFLLLPLAGCQPAPPGAATLSAADQAAIPKVADDAVALVNSDTPDLDAYAQAYYAPDAVVMPPNAPALTGPAAFAAYTKAFPPISDFKFQIVEMEGTADMAWVRGTYSMTISPPGAEPVNDVGKYIEIWKKQADGGWRAVRDIINSDLPMVAPSGGAGT